MDQGAHKPQVLGTVGKSRGHGHGWKDMGREREVFRVVPNNVNRMLGGLFFVFCFFQGDFGLRISPKFALSLLPGSQTESRSHSLLLLFPLKFPRHTWARRGAAGLLLGGLPQAECVPGAGAQPRTLPPTRVTPRDKAALGAGGPGRPGCPTWYLWQERQYRPIV